MSTGLPSVATDHYGLAREQKNDMNTISNRQINSNVSFGKTALKIISRKKSPPVTKSRKKRKHNLRIDIHAKSLSSVCTETYAKKQNIHLHSREQKVPRRGDILPQLDNIWVTTPRDVDESRSKSAPPTSSTLTAAGSIRGLTLQRVPHSAPETLPGRMRGIKAGKNGTNKKLPPGALWSFTLNLACVFEGAQCNHTQVNPDANHMEQSRQQGFIPLHYRSFARLALRPTQPPAQILDNGFGVRLFGRYVCRYMPKHLKGYLPDQLRFIVPMVVHRSFVDANPVTSVVHKPRASPLVPGGLIYSPRHEVYVNTKSTRLQDLERSSKPAISRASSMPSSKPIALGKTWPGSCRPASKHSLLQASLENSWSKAQLGRSMSAVPHGPETSPIATAPTSFFRSQEELVRYQYPIYAMHYYERSHKVNSMLSNHLGCMMEHRPASTMWKYHYLQQDRPVVARLLLLLVRKLKFVATRRATKAKLAVKRRASSGKLRKWFPWDILYNVPASTPSPARSPSSATRRRNPSSPSSNGNHNNSAKPPSPHTSRAFSPITRNQSPVQHSSGDRRQLKQLQREKKAHKRLHHAIVMRVLKFIGFVGTATRLLPPVNNNANVEVAPFQRCAMRVFENQRSINLYTNDLSAIIYDFVPFETYSKHVPVQFTANAKTESLGSVRMRKRLMRLRARRATKTSVEQLEIPDASSEQQPCATSALKVPDSPQKNEDLHSTSLPLLPSPTQVKKKKPEQESPEHEAQARKTAAVDWVDGH